MLYEKILVPLDGTELAEKALPYAKVIAKQKKRTIVLFAVSLTMFADRRDRLFTSYLEVMAKELGEEGFQTTTATSYGKVPEEIVKYANNNHIDLIVMASHGYTKAKQWMFGSNTQKVLYNTAIPVLLIKATSPEASAEFNRILVPIDGSPFSESTFPHLEELAKNTKKEVLLLHICEAPVVPSYGSRPINQKWKKYRDETWAEMEKQAAIYLEKTTAEMKKKRMKVASRLEKAKTGDVAKTIIQVASEDKTDLIMISTQGRTAVGHLVYGHVANRIVEESSVPILLIRPPASIHPPSPARISLDAEA